MFLKKNWGILKANRHLEQILSNVPKCTYRRAPTLRDGIAKNVVVPPSKRNFSFFEGKGYYPCKNCYTCRHMKVNKKKKEEFRSVVTVVKNKIDDFTSCITERVVYILECPYHVQSVGRMKRPLWKCLREHTQNIKKCFSKHSLLRHYAQYHNKGFYLLVGLWYRKI